MNRNVTAVILIVLAFGIYLTWTSPKLADIKTVRAVNDQYAQAAENASRLIKVRDQVLKDFGSLTAEDKDRLDKIVPNTTDNIRLVIDLSNMAARRGLALRGVKATLASKPNPNNPAPTDSGGSIPTPVVDSVTISFTVSTTYQQFITFMRDLESNLRVMDVTHLSMSANDTGVYDYTVQLRTYWLPQP